MKIILPLVLFSLFALPAAAQQQFERDTIKTTAGELQIFFVGHGSLMMQFNGKTIQIDPFSSLADYTKLPKADLILITHEHQDHLDTAAIEKVRTKDTQVLLTEAAVEKLAGATVMKNGDARTAFGITIEAVPAYNLIHKRENGQPERERDRGTPYRRVRLAVHHVVFVRWRLPGVRHLHLVPLALHRSVQRHHVRLRFVVLDRRPIKRIVHVRKRNARRILERLLDAQRARRAVHPLDVK